MSRLDNLYALGIRIAALKDELAATPEPLFRAGILTELRDLRAQQRGVY